MASDTPKEQRRETGFAERTVTRIWREEAAADNPYLAARCACHGYDLLELMEKRSFGEVFFLLFNGELPSVEQARLLERLLIAFVNPGPRHPATRAAMNAAVGHTFSQHILPIASAVAGGEFLGGVEVEQAMRFLRKNLAADPRGVAAELVATVAPPPEGDWHIAPGFGCRFGGIDPLPQQIAAALAGMAAAGKALAWGMGLVAALKPHRLGWVATGVVAAALCDLGFSPRLGAGLFQIISAPGLLAQGAEMANKPVSAMPFVDEDHYVIAKDARTRKG